MKVFYKIPCDKLKLKCALRAAKIDGYWEQVSLPIGNGSLGLSMIDEAKNERIIVNHKTLWTGGSADSRPNYNGGNLTKADRHGKTVKDYFFEVRNLFKEGNDKDAAALCNKLVGEEEGYGAYQCWGEIVISYDGTAKKEKEYSRALDLEDAVYTVAMPSSGIVKEYFVSHPDNAAAMRITKLGGGLALALQFPSHHAAETIAEPYGIFHNGTVRDNGLKFSSALLVDTDGTVKVLGEKLSIQDASFVTLYLSADTDYDDNYPVYRTGESLKDVSERVLRVAESAKLTGFNAMLVKHKADYHALYKRLLLDIGGTDDIVPTNTLLKKYKKGRCSDAEKRALETLLYQFGRYLTIASSRGTDKLPSNLQGIWNISNSPIWSSDFHLNINLQMNYWPTMSANLGECATPLLRYVQKLVQPGRVTAEVYTGVKSADGEANGFMFHTQNTPFGWTCPGWDFNWGWSPAAVAWILHNVYEMYEYTQDKELLKEQIYPMLKESADYFAKLLVADKTGRLVSSPCFSPEHGPKTMGNTYEQCLNYQLFKDAADAADSLKLDPEKSEAWRAILSKLSPIEIGTDGQLKEWYTETKLGEIGQLHHRHLSHLLGFYPLNVIDKYKNPEALQAVVVSLNNRGDKSVGWAMAQRINTWARTGDGARAYSLLSSCIKHSIHQNLWDVHPPFQIDGNFGFTAGVNEMLVQSHLGRIELLPTLPPAWKSGKIFGIVARGNFELDLTWQGGKLLSAKVLSRAGGLATFSTPFGKLKADAGKISYLEDGALCISTKKGDSFTLTLG